MWMRLENVIAIFYVCKQARQKTWKLAHLYLKNGWHDSFLQIPYVASLPWFVGTSTSNLALFE